MAISRVVRGGYDTIVKLNDGTVTTLSKYLRAPGALTIDGVARMGYNAMITDSTATVRTLAEHSRLTVNAAGVQTVAKFLGTGYDTVVLDDSGNKRPLAKYQADADGVAVSDAPEDAPGAGEGGEEVVHANEATKIEDEK